MNLVILKVIEEIEKILEDEQEKARIEIAELVNTRLNKIAAKELICVVNEDFSVKLITKSQVINVLKSMECVSECLKNTFLVIECIYNVRVYLVCMLFIYLLF